MQDVPQLPQEWAARDRALRCRQARQTLKVTLTTAILVLLCILIWLNSPLTNSAWLDSVPYGRGRWVSDGSGTAAGSSV
jgi:hypothetical protein